VSPCFTVPRTHEKHFLPPCFAGICQVSHQKFTQTRSIQDSVFFRLPSFVSDSRFGASSDRAVSDTGARTGIDTAPASPRQRLPEKPTQSRNTSSANAVGSPSAFAVSHSTASSVSSFKCSGLRPRLKGRKRSRSSGLKASNTGSFVSARGGESCPDGRLRRRKAGR